MLAALKLYLQSRINVSEEHFEILSKEIVYKEIKKGAILLRSLEVCSSMFFVAKGMLRSYTIDSQGKEHIIQFALENWWIGDRNSFYFTEGSDFFIDSIEDSEVVYISKAFYTKAEVLVPGFNSFNVLALHNSIRYMQRRINLLLGATAEERYIDFLKLYPTLSLRIPQWMIASYLGITPESLSRVRKELTSKKM